MAQSVDATVARVLDSQKNANLDDEDALIAALEEEEDDPHFGALAAMREKRLEQLHQEFNKAKILRENEHGTYQTIKEEKNLMDITASTKLCIVHFKKSDFNRCRIMDEKLGVLAEKHIETRFVSIDVENAPFLVVKLNLRVLPCVIAFKDGISIDRIVGFEGVGRKPDTITATELEARLLQSEVLVRPRLTEEDNNRNARREERERKADYDDDEDWD